MCTRCGSARCCGERGGASEIFAEAIHDDLAGEAYKYWTYRTMRPCRRRRHVPVHDLLQPLAGFLVEQELPLILDFHNFTGPELFAGWEPHSVVRAARAG